MAQFAWCFCLQEAMNHNDESTNFGLVYTNPYRATQITSIHKGPTLPFVTMAEGPEIIYMLDNLLLGLVGIDYILLRINVFMSHQYTIDKDC